MTSSVKDPKAVDKTSSKSLKAVHKTSSKYSKAVHSSTSKPDSSKVSKGVKKNAVTPNKEAPQGSTNEPSVARKKVIDSKDLNKKKWKSTGRKLPKISDTESVTIIDEDDKSYKSKLRSPNRKRKLSTPWRNDHQNDETDKENISEDLPKIKNRRGSHKLGKKMDKSSVQCNICHKIFANKDNLKVHIKSSYMIKKFTCKECDKVYSRKQTLRGHVKAEILLYLWNLWKRLQSQRKLWSSLKCSLGG